MKCVELIIAYPVNLTMLEGEWYYEAYADVYPEDAACRCVTWHSDNPSVASVNAESGYIHAEAPGTANIYATACDGSGVSGVCRITVEAYVPVTSVTISPPTKTLGLNETTYLSATVYPENATNRLLTWSSNKESVATVHPLTGKVTPVSGGNATITARADDNGKIGTCEITVDDRPEVLIKKDGNFINIVFPDGTEWKSVEYDLSLDKNRSCTISQWEDKELFEEGFFKQERNYLYNRKYKENFPPQKLAFIYQFDPLGVEFFVKNAICPYMDLKDGLRYKDSLYTMIFGEPSVTRFAFDIVDGKKQYIVYDKSIPRDTYHTHAEILFGSYSSFDYLECAKDFIEIIFNITANIASIYFPVIEFFQTVMTTVEIYQMLFHAGSFVGLASGAAISFGEDYLSNPKNVTADGILGNRAKKLFKWASNFLYVYDFYKSTLQNFVIPNVKDMTIYEKVKDQSAYRVIFEGFDRNLTMEEIIEICTNSAV